MISAMPRIAIAVHDFAGAVSTFRHEFGMPVVDFSERTVPSLGAHVGMCVPDGGSNIELMAPADPELPLSQALQKFLDRRGEGLYALMLEAPDPQAEAEDLLERGVKVLPLMEGAGGRDIHPTATHGVLIRVYPNDSAPTGSGHRSAEPHLSGITRAIVATNDAAVAADAYAGGLGLDVDPLTNDDDRGVQSVLVRPPKGGVIELVSPTDPTRPLAGEIARFLDRTGEGMFALVLRADQPRAAAAQLEERGLAAAGPSGCGVAAFGTRLLIE
ncbi:MAG: VOC family protein [Acidimicrobiia bacterium]|nr:VOC family protein [Acidimicrobiia bacterium]